MSKTRLPFPRLHHLGSAVVSALLLLLFLGPASTRSSEPESSPTLPLHLERHFPELARVASAPPTDRRAGRPTPSARERYLASIPYSQEIRRAARSQGLDSLLLASVVEAESAFRPDAVSPKGALGLMQLLPLHFAAHEEPFDPAVNLATGAEYLAQMRRRFDGDLELALAAYHAGPSAVERFGGLPPYRETRQYVGRVLDLYRVHQSSLSERSAAPLERFAQRGS
jgi:soluble lytic murein transglycosylase